ncbi:MAG: hypothetical protein ACYTGS_15500 [Planctomycetota bacterium]
MKWRWAVILLVVAGCASTDYGRQKRVDCSGFRDSNHVVQARNPIRRCYIHVYDPEVWGRMSSSSWILSRRTSTFPDTLAPLSIVNGFVSSLTDEEAAVLVRVQGVSVYECGRTSGVSDLDVIAYIQSEAKRSERKVPQPEALKIPSYADGAVTVAVCSALSKIKQANLEHGVEYEQ